MNMTQQNIWILLLVFGILIGCEKNRRPPVEFPPTDLSQSQLIPKPNKVTSTGDAFGLDQFTAIHTSENNASLAGIGKFLAEKIQQKTGLTLSVNSDQVSDIDRIIFIEDDQVGGNESDEAYQILIGRDSIILKANKPAGAFRGVQTLRQLIPEVSVDTLAEWSIWPIATGKISDAPYFEFRGSMLDVSRHFFTVEEVKKYIDLLAYYKMNALHLGLSNDQGWRIEIKGWPRLAEIGGSTEVGGKDGGYYSQEDYTEIVRYASEHFMTIIPEINMPGHSNAASVSYPFLDGTGQPLKLYEGTKVGFSSFDTQKDSVYLFIDQVIDELAGLTPGPYLHIGGDETHVTKSEDFVHFISKVEKIVQKHGKKMIGWDEVANADLDSSSIAQFWASEKNAENAVKKGMKVILSPAKKTYLDMKYDSLSTYGLDWAGFIPVDTAYLWSPEDYSKKIPRQAILGIEAPLWSETISNSSELEYLAFPRVIGHAELGWSLPEHRNWEDYKQRLSSQAAFLDRMDVNYYPAPMIDWKVAKSP